MTGTPTRRSALEGIHVHLGGAWPMSYGDARAEAEAAAQTIGLAEPGLYDKLWVRGRGALAAIRALSLAATPGRVTPAPPGGINVWAIADDEVLLVAYAPIPGGPEIAPVELPRLGAGLRRAGLGATDVSSGWSVLRLVGPACRDLLAELVATDLSAASVPDQAIVQVTMAGSRVILARRDHGAVPGFTLLVARDEAEHLWHAFLELGEGYGIRPVGASALVAPAAPAPAQAAVGGTR